MSTLSRDRQNVVNFGARRGERVPIDAEKHQIEERSRQLDELRLELERERAALIEERQLLERERDEFEEELGVLEDQRRFLDGQRENLRREAAVLETEREALGRGQAIASQRRRVESALEDARRSREADKQRLQAELAGLLQR